MKKNGPPKAQYNITDVQTVFPFTLVWRIYLRLSHPWKSFPQHVLCYVSKGLGLGFKNWQCTTLCLFALSVSLSLSKGGLSKENGTNEWRGKSLLTEITGQLCDSTQRCCGHPRRCPQWLLTVITRNLLDRGGVCNKKNIELRGTCPFNSFLSTALLWNTNRQSSETQSPVQ